jgi:hypothetical protein
MPRVCLVCSGPAGEPNGKGVGWLDWPCGQNPGRKPEGRQRASTREATSPGKQDSTVGPAPCGRQANESGFRRSRSASAASR